MITAVYQAKADVKEVIVRVFTYLKMDPTGWLAYCEYCLAHWYDVILPLILSI